MKTKNPNNNNSKCNLLRKITRSSTFLKEILNFNHVKIIKEKF